MKLEEKFAKLFGRPPEDVERQRLTRIRDALELGDNDALWAIVMALEHYDSLYRKYPEQLARETERAIDKSRQAFAAAAAADASSVHAAIAKHAVRELAKKMTGRSVGTAWIAAAAAGRVAFGAICLSAGATLAGGARPFWATRGAGAAGPRAVLGLVLGAPAGWMAFALLLPAAWACAASGWELAREPAEGAGRWVGWAMMAASVLGALGCAVLLLEVM